MTSLYGDVQVGRMRLLDADFEAHLGSDGALKLTVQASPSRMTNAAVERRGQDMLGLDGQTVPVVFSDKQVLSGWYRVTAVDLTHWSYPGNVGRRQVVATAELELRPLGVANTAAVESRLSGAATRRNDYGLTGQVWHAPAGGHAGYRASTGLPPICRRGTDGPLTVYRALAGGSHPQWSVPLEQYGAGRVRFLDPAGDERTGERFPIPATTITGGLYPSEDLFPADDLFPDAGLANVAGWELHNGLIRVRPLAEGGLLEVAAFTGAAWHATAWDVQLDRASVGPLSTAEAIHNTYDTVTARLTCQLYPGVVTVDVTVRRGARVAELFISSSYPGDLAVARPTTTAATGAHGWLAATADDTAGNRWITGSARTVTKDLTKGRIVREDATSMDAFVGYVVGGSAAQAGDTAADLYLQYLGSLAEQMVVIRR